MIQIRPAGERGHVQHGWLDSRHTFSFGDYYDPSWMGFGPLRVINEDWVAPGAGFAPHSHQDMEIISYVLEGGLRHRDSTGGGSVLRHGEVQLMTAGRGITHSEMNASPGEGVHFLQIWIQPDTKAAAPGYQQQALDAAALREGFAKIVAPAAERAPFRILQDARLLVAWPDQGRTLAQTLDPARRYYLHLARGRLRAATRELHAGDALMLTRESALKLETQAPSEVLLFDLA
jgi:redox-sensitive bicupin YhaK (pirin superfamily)